MAIFIRILFERAAINGTGVSGVNTVRRGILMNPKEFNNKAQAAPIVGACVVAELHDVRFRSSRESLSNPR